MVRLDAIGEADAFLRWQEVRIKHFGYTANLVLTLTTAALGFAVNLAVDNKIVLTKLFVAALIFLGLAMFVGLLTNYSRLLDFRHTAKAARSRELHARETKGETLDEEDRKVAAERSAHHRKSDCYGKWSWRLLPIQLIVFFVGVFLLGTSVLLWRPPHPRPQAGRFVNMDNNTNPYLLLDTATGQLCIPPGWPNLEGRGIRNCSDLR